MKIFLSAVSHRTCGNGDKRNMSDYFLDEGLKYNWNLLSYYYIKNESDYNSAVRCRDNSKEILIDSGAHSFQKGKKVDWVQYTKEYAEFIKNFDRPNVIGYFEMDVDNIIGYEKVLELRKILESVSNKIIPVWHPNRGIDDFKKMCKKYSGKIIAITGFKNNEIKDEQYLMFLKYAKKYNCKVHCLGMTRKKILDKVPFDYVDSSSWIAIYVIKRRKIMYIGIISYLPDNEKIRNKRKLIHKKQLKWLETIFKDKTINVVAQNYKDEDYIEGINYFKIKEGIGPSRARNILLKDFYNTDDKFILLLDDDCILYDYYDGYKLLLELDKNPDKFKGINNIVANNPKYLPFKKDNYNDKNILKYWKLIKRPFNTGAPFAVYSNVKNIFFNEDNNPKENLSSEDVDFHIRWVKKGYNSFICTQWQVKEMSGNDSTVFSENRIEEEKKCVKNMLKKLNLDIIKNDKINWKYLDKYNRTIKKGYIKREDVYEYKDIEIPR